MNNTSNPISLSKGKVLFLDLHTYLKKQDYRAIDIIGNMAVYFNPRKKDTLRFKALNTSFNFSELKHIFNSSATDLPAELELARLQIFLFQINNH